MTEVKDEKNVEIKKEAPKEAIKKETTEEKIPKEEQKCEEIEVPRRYRPLSTFRSVDRFFNDLTKWFDDMFWRPFNWDFEPLSLRVFDEDEFFRTPLSNVTEDEKGYHMSAELPGLDKGDLEITVHDGTLELKGEHKDEHEEKDDKGYVRREYSNSSYYRTFTLPENVDEDKIDATLDKGILKLELPKKPVEEKPKKKVEVQ